MASAAGGSGAGGGDRCPSGEKSTTRVGCRSKKLVLFIGQRSVIWKKNIENAWQGARNLRLILRIYCGVRFVTTKLGGFSSAIFFCASKKSVRTFCVPTQGRLKTYVLLSEFLSFMLSTPLLSSVMD